MSIKRVSGYLFTFIYPSFPSLCLYKEDITYAFTTFNYPCTHPIVSMLVFIVLATQEACTVSMACIVDGHGIPLVFSIHDRGCARVLSHLLHVHFKFVESSIYVEEERKSESRELLKSILIARCVEKDGHCRYLIVGNSRAYELPLSMLALSIEILSQ